VAGRAEASDEDGEVILLDGVGVAGVGEGGVEVVAAVEDDAEGWLKCSCGTSYRSGFGRRCIVGEVISMMSISVRNCTVASSRWLVWAVALFSFRPTVMWMCGPRYGPAVGGCNLRISAG